MGPIRVGAEKESVIARSRRGELNNIAVRERLPLWQISYLWVSKEVEKGPSLAAGQGYCLGMKRCEATLPGLLRVPRCLIIPFKHNRHFSYRLGRLDPLAAANSAGWIQFS